MPRTEVAKFKAGADLAKRITVVASADGADGAGGQASAKVRHSSASASIQNIR